LQLIATLLEPSTGLGNEKEKTLTPYFSVESKRIKQNWALAMIDVFMAIALIIYSIGCPQLKSWG
jgi:hypothetical protein